MASCFPANLVIPLLKPLNLENLFSLLAYTMRSFAVSTIYVTTVITTKTANKATNV